VTSEPALPPKAFIFASASEREKDSSFPVKTNSSPSKGNFSDFAFSTSSLFSFTLAFFSFSIIWIFPSCLKKATMLSAILGPMEGRVESSSWLASASWSILWNCSASSSAYWSPTCRIPRAKITRANGLFLLF